MNIWNIFLSILDGLDQAILDTVNLRYKQTQYKQKLAIDRSFGGPVHTYGICYNSSI